MPTRPQCRGRRSRANEVEDAPIVRFLNKMLMDAINMGASDIHFEPYEKHSTASACASTACCATTAQPPLSIRDKLVSRIKVLAKLDISEKRVPQDGRMRLVLSPTKTIDFRVSTLPTLFGEKTVMRILDATQAQMGIDALGYDPDQKALLLDAIQRPYGMVLVTGPTGSGKTVSLYTCLNVLNKPGINISTAEDPAEINLPGVNQVNVNDKRRPDLPGRAESPSCARIRTSSWSARSATWKPPTSPSRPRRPATWCFRPCTPTTRRRP
jgi:type IV pilus assembly protein PilB